MIFDANSGEFWQIFARQGMRNLRNSQLERGEVCIEDVELAQVPGRCSGASGRASVLVFSGAFG